MQTLNILLVEDNDVHAEDCTSMLAEIQDRLPAQVILTRATNLKEALPLVDSADGVLTDVFYPMVPNGAAEVPSGQSMVAHCLQVGKPVVWCTSTYHHGTATNAVSQWGRERGLEMFDAASSGDGEAPVKPWDAAIAGIVLLVLGVESGTHTITSTGITPDRNINYPAEQLMKDGPFNRRKAELKQQAKAAWLPKLQPLWDCLTRLDLIEPLISNGTIEALEGEPTVEWATAVLTQLRPCWGMRNALNSALRGREGYGEMIVLIREAQEVYCIYY